MSALLDATTAAQVQAAMQAASGNLDAMLPVHILDVSSTGAVDLLGNWDLLSSGPSADLVPTPFGSGHFAMRTRIGGDVWNASGLVPYNLGGGIDWCLGILAFFDDTGSGDWAIGNCDDPFFTGEGLTISANADGGIGFQIAGTGGLLNVDTAAGVSVGKRWLWFFFGYRFDIEYGTLAWGADTLGPNPSELIAANGPVGDITSNAEFGLHGVTLNVAGADLLVARVITWTGADAINVLDNVNTQGAIGVLNADLYSGAGMAKPLIAEVHRVGDPGASSDIERVTADPRTGLVRDVGSLADYVSSAGPAALLAKASAAATAWLPLSQGDDPEIGFPAYRRYAPRTGHTPTGLRRFQDASGNLLSNINTTDTALVAAGTIGYRYMLAGLRGMNFATVTSGFAGNTFDPGAASQAVGWLYSQSGHYASNAGIGGWYDGTTFLALYVRPIDDHLVLHVVAGDSAVIDLGLVTFGHLYEVRYQIDRAANLIRTRVLDVTSGVVTTSTLSLATFGPFGGGASPNFYVCYIVGVADSTVTQIFGLDVLSGADAEGADVLESMSVGCGFE